MLPVAVEDPGRGTLRRQARKPSSIPTYLFGSTAGKGVVDYKMRVSRGAEGKRLGSVAEGEDRDEPGSSHPLLSGQVGEGAGKEDGGGVAGWESVT